MDRDTGTTIKPIMSTNAPILRQHNKKCKFLAVFCFTNIFLMWMYTDLCVCSIILQCQRTKINPVTITSQDTLPKLDVVYSVAKIDIII